MFNGSIFIWKYFKKRLLANNFFIKRKMDKVHSIEKISTGKLVLRHFVTNNYNELYEDADGSIYISADKKGIYKFSFEEFR